MDIAGLQGFLPLSKPFSTTAPLVGYRLQRLEVLNWGTFDQDVWTLDLKHQNGLLTGDIGSGKSTLVDALTTLLLRSDRIAYNKAAGADSRERTLRTYVLGRYGALRNEENGSAKPQELRKPGTYSVILGVFRNEGYEETTTLAQVFWFKDAQAPPERFYLCADRELTVIEDCRPEGPDMAGLRKRLRQSKGIEVFDTFTEYAATFRRRFHVPGEQAWDLFHQTVSMKSVGNLTEFVREHMLEVPKIDQRIADLLQHFEDLTAAHAAVVKAKNQVALLTPLVDDCDRYEAQTGELRFLRECRDHLRPYFAALRVQLLEMRLGTLAVELGKHIARLERRQEQKARELEAVAQLKRAVTEQGGDRLEQLDLNLERLRRDFHIRRTRANRYEEDLRLLGLLMPQDEAAFEKMQLQVNMEADEAKERKADLENRKVEASVDFRTQRREHEELHREITSLSKRPSNIPDFYVQLRARLAQEVNVPVEELPFAGELLQVKQEDVAWEGALERLLHSFALSLLVHDEQYPHVVQWVNRTHLNGRLVYLRILPRWNRTTDSTPLSGNAAARKLEIKAQTRFSTWLQGELRDRFDIACLATDDDFQRASSALSITGQVKEGRGRHIKDDRRRIDDRSNYVLGWSSASKIAALKQKMSALERNMQADGNRISKLDDELRHVDAKRQAVERCRAVQLFDDLNWREIEADLQRLEEERRRLENASDTLAELRGQLRDADTMLQESEKVIEAFRKDIARTEAKIEAAQQGKAEAENSQKDVSQNILARISEVRTSEQNAELTVENCGAQEHSLREEFQRRIDAEEKQVARVKDRILLAMQKFRAVYPLDTSEMDCSIEAHGEYRKFLEQLTYNDLPRFEERFQEELRKNAIHRIALLHNEFQRQMEEIRDRIGKINESLTEIEYSRGRYISLTHQPSFYPEIQQFRDDLRACTDSEVHGSSDDQYAEAKFEQVKRILDRLRGRPVFVSDDRRWRALVTDVRNWFQFAASERWMEDDREYENHSDTSGKSGGQKEKLAYTVLAASLAYHFGLDWQEKDDRSKQFRFVVIDEAFGRGSEESADFALRLFQKLNLQLLIVTPLQKINVIEPYVASVALVENRSGHTSKLLNMSIEEHRRRKAALR